MLRICLLLISILPLLTVRAFSQTTAPPQATQPQSGEVPIDDDSPQEYVRIRRNQRRAAIALETSVIHFGRAKMYPQSTVDLIGAIHLGEAEYYENLNELFKAYDVVLFEAVMPEAAVRRGLRPGGGGRGVRLDLKQKWTDAKVGLHAIGILQEGAKDILGLEFQLAAVDYWAKNFVHADMTQEEMEAVMAKRGESFSMTLAREAGKEALRNQQVSPVAQNIDLLLSVFATDRKYRLRRIGAVQLEKANNGDAFAGSDGTSTIITERNIKALNVLKQQLQRGERKIGIFYGAGHFPDMESRVVEEFGFQRLSEKWLTAWHLTEPKNQR